MPVANLNKVIGLFLVGSIGLLWMLLMSWGTVQHWLGTIQLDVDFLSSLFSGLLLLAIAGIVGVAIDGVNDFTIRRWLRHSTHSRTLAGLFLQQPLFHSLSRWRRYFNVVAANHPVLQPEYQDTSSSNPADFQLATEFVLAHASKPQFDWITSHYSTYHLASNFCLMLAAFTALPLKLLCMGQLDSLKATALVLVFAIGAIVSAIAAVDRYIYTYFATFRFAALWLQERNELNGSLTVDEPPVKPQQR